MPDILHRVGIGVPPERVYAALATIEGLRHWWVVDTTGNPATGGSINFVFCEMAVVRAVPNELVRWRCTRGPDEWLGTEVVFRLEWKDNQTFVIFKHANWKEAVEFMHHCSTKWASFLLSLKGWLERAEGRPAPYDLKIHVGD
ncbi:MAG: SRPBCC domain-containing protein [Rhodocyclaceae bacterium]|nr:MAG: SRPBCC domain-containing protein [Rhodocyclaceae bacterium]